MGEFTLRAAEDSDLKGIRQLIELDVDVRDDKGRTPLHLAAEHGRYEEAKLLISNHCNVNLEDRDGCTPVMLAAEYGRKYFVHLLLQSGAQVNYADRDGCTVLHLASCNGWADVVQRIMAIGGADVNAASSGGWTPLVFAADSGHEDVAALLLRAGADVHRRNKWKRTALHCASCGGHTKVVQVLLEEEGLHLNPKDEMGDTPLHFACWLGRTKVMKQLLTAGADTCIKNNDGETALSTVIRRNYPTLEVIRLFLQHGYFFEDRDYALISENPVLKDLVLKDVDLCTQSIVNRFHRQSLPALYSNPDFAKKLPSIENFKLNAPQMHDVENFVKCDIQTNKFCNIVKARPIVLRLMCVQSLLLYQSGTKRSPDFSDSYSPLKKTHHN